MKSLSAIVLGVFAASAVGQVTLTPTTICRGSTCTTTCATRTVVVPTTTTATSVVTQVTTVTATLVKTTTYTTTKTTVSTTTKNCAPAPNCPVLTSTGTACKTCLVPGCATTQVVTKSCGCNSLATTTVNFPCNDPEACGRISCKTVYAIETQAC